jgi:hypothetical protein
MTTYAYSKVFTDVLHRVEQLSPEEQERLVEELAKIIRQRTLGNSEKKHNVMEFRGMAKDFWKGVDIKKFIEEERNSWDG